jgi:hypothetical protein
LVAQRELITDTPTSRTNLLSLLWSLIVLISIVLHEG